MAVDNIARALAAKAIAGGGAGSSSGSGVQVQADWNVNDESNSSFIKNKPFSDNSTVIFRKDSLDKYQGYDHYDDGRVFPCIYFELGQNELTLVDGETYHIKCSSDQGIVEHTGKARNIGGVFFAGDYLSEDGIFFLNCAIKIMVVETYDKANPSFIGINFRNLVADTEDAAPTLTNVSISIEKLVTKKIPSKFLELSDIQVQADWNTTDESDPSFIKNKPFGDDVIFRKDSLDKYQNFVNIDSGWIPSVDLELEPNKLTLVEGETYHVKCSSDQGIVEYTGKAKLAADFLNLGDCFLENGNFNPDYTVDILIKMSNRVPPYIETGIQILFHNLKADTEDAVPTLTNVSITIEKGEIKKIPSKFLELSDIQNRAQADWNDSDDTSPSFIKNKPNISTVYMVYKSKYDNGDYLISGSITGKPLYEAVRNGSTIYYVDDTNAASQSGRSNITYYPITSISIVQTCGASFEIICTYISWEYDTSSTTYVCTRNELSMSFTDT